MDGATLTTRPFFPEVLSQNKPFFQATVVADRYFADSSNNNKSLLINNTNGLIKHGGDDGTSPNVETTHVFISL